MTPETCCGARCPKCDVWPEHETTDELPQCEQCGARRRIMAVLEATKHHPEMRVCTPCWGKGL